MFNIPAEYRPFVNSIKRKCRYHGVNLVLSPSKQVVLTDDFKNECSGYFSGEDKVLVVACGRPIEDWMPIFVHESSHLDQWLKDPRDNDWAEACASLWDYMAGAKLLNRAQLKAVVDQVIELEADCERRSLEKIKKWKLPINIDLYCRKANAYIYSYRIMGEYKKFPTGIYDDELILSIAPNRLDDSYDTVPLKLNKELHRFMGELKETA